MVNILVHLHTRPDILLESMSQTESRRDDVYERALSSVCGRYKVEVAEYNGRWTPVKYPWHILDAAEHFLEKADGFVSPAAEVSGKATVEGKVIIEDGVKILENAVVRGPVYIGRNSVIGNSTLVRGNTHIGENCVVGFGTELKGRISVNITSFT